MHSLHAYFLRPGDPQVPIVFSVERLSDGRSFSARRVTAIQHGRPIFNLSASFALAEEGHEHASTMPVVPPPDSLVPDSEVLAPYGEEGGWLIHRGPLEVRTVGVHSRVARDLGQKADRLQVWMRANGPLPDDPVLHVCVVAYASDLTLLDVTMRPHGLSLTAGDVIPTSLDHAMWFHRPIRADQWWFYDMDTPWAGGGRGLARGLIYAADGSLAAEVVQEGLVRKPRTAPTHAVVAS